MKHQRDHDHPSKQAHGGRRLCTRHGIFAPAAALALTWLMGCQSQLPTVDTLGMTEPVMILRQQSGSDAALQHQGAWLINSQKQLDALGSDQLLKLQVDFNSESLVVVALGVQPTGGYWVRIWGLSRLGDQLYIQGQANRPRSMPSAQVLTYPYAAAVISKIPEARLHPEFESLQDEEDPQEKL